MLDSFPSSLFFMPFFSAGFMGGSNHTYQKGAREGNRALATVQGSCPSSLFFMPFFSAGFIGATGIDPSSERGAITYQKGAREGTQHCNGAGFLP